MIVVCQSEEEAADQDAYRHLFSPTRGRYDTLNKVHAQQKDGDVA
jgi:hypothetical protein